MSRFGYLPHTNEDRDVMLRELGVASVEELFRDIPSSVRLTTELALPRPMSELELNKHMEQLAGRNRHLGQWVSFLGAGAYEHYQPSVVDAILSRSEFYSSYTPYQPEMSQGLLQAIFEYQTMVAELTGTDIANASMYDGVTALAEAALVACQHTRRDKVVVASTLHPDARKVLRTYANGQSIQLEMVPHRSGVLDVQALERLVDADTACVCVQYPNFFGAIEDVRAIAEIAHRHGALLVVQAYPIALGLLEAPGKMGADIVVAEGQPLGISPSYGGPYLGVMAVKEFLMRRIPGRLVGETTDAQGRRGFVLTLQAREQHIRREKATSNICTNQSLCAIAATVFLAYMGKEGLQEMARQNYHKAHYFRQKLLEVPGIEPLFEGPFFNEFTVRLSRPVLEVERSMMERGYLFGYALTGSEGVSGEGVVLAVTEVRTRAEMDGAVDALEEVLAR
ncbi:aminomethyl-transferring glycine dehydrogenase subunit GcvPA [Alicyclobacillus vulcanalis]|uniref:Probable glycine dehydrogenase (decarboxylating) subunit 1 n=1 Tax=Alicyclobacillus vulcanalis TaxID=252246 RepID=A0A1N7KP44_9BACL|nr:aminomethyl-transferring glycine dehydrogenase subunit GcvPA [Alicyclobacillus vulcanalis]SIS63373.1 glycine dehydrogenase (decarboxylating) alpha subunit [Alicyclobacillus vulcanalis]